jgi:hypothetical protein
MNQHAQRINEIINEHQKDNTYWWNNAPEFNDNGDNTSYYFAKEARDLVAIMVCGDAQRFKDFIYREYVDGRNRAWYEKHYDDLNEEQKNDISTFVEYAYSALADHEMMYDSFP